MNYVSAIEVLNAVGLASQKSNIEPKNEGKRALSPLYDAFALDINTAGTQENAQNISQPFRNTVFIQRRKADAR